MHKTGTPWPVATRVRYIVSFEELRRQHPHLSARRFCEAAEVPYPTFARWWAAWRQKGKCALLDMVAVMLGPVPAPEQVHVPVASSMVVLEPW